jgi:sorting nexin-29
MWKMENIGGFLSIELLSLSSSTLITGLHIFLNTCWITYSLPHTWRSAHLILPFTKGDKNSCNNYRDISVLNSGYKIYTKIINERLKTIMDAFLLEEQQEFRKGRSAIDNIFIVQQIIEKRCEFNLEMHISFIDFEKASDKIDRNKL